MREERFKIIQFIRELIIIVDKELDNFPKKDIEYKNRIRNLSFDVLELAYEANTVSNIKSKKDYVEKIFGKIKLLDFLLNMCYDKMIITKKKYFKFGEKMDDIIKYTTGWINSLNKQN
ncbi:MAG: four helix bundle protein [Clostridia bacterium]|nr:four helix bundle protein [Clostridia bacterium]